MHKRLFQHMMSLAWVAIFVGVILSFALCVDCDPANDPAELDRPSVPQISSGMKPGTEKYAIKGHPASMKPSQFVDDARRLNPWAK